MNTHVWYKQTMALWKNKRSRWFISSSIQSGKVEYNPKIHIHDEYLSESVCNAEVGNKVNLELKRNIFRNVQLDNMISKMRWEKA